MYLVQSGWVQIFLLVVGWVGSVRSWVGLDGVTQNGPVTNCAIRSSGSVRVGLILSSGSVRFDRLIVRIQFKFG